MSHKITDMDKIFALPWLVIASLTNQIFWFMAIAGSVVVLFFNELGMDKTRIGVLLSIVPFFQIVGVFSGNMIARIGYRTGFLVFYTLRIIIASLILLSPLMLKWYSVEVAFYWIAAVFVIFSIFRALAETAWFPWSKELIPDSIRGKFNAINAIAATIASIITFFAAGYVIDKFQGISRFIYLIVFGLAMGVAAIFCYALLPGGKPEFLSKSAMPGIREFLETRKDKNFIRFLVGVGVASFAYGSMLSFVPLYLKEAIGIAPGVVIWIDMASMAGTTLLVYFWGWACDRYGSKPIMIVSLALSLLLPIGWMLMPRNNSGSIYFAFIISFLAGSAFIGWAVSFMGMYLIKVAVPEDKKNIYLPIFYSFIGVVGGCAPLFAGWLLDVSTKLNVQYGTFILDSYTLLFSYGFVLLILSIKILSRLRPDGDVSAQEFVGMIFQTNPVTSFGNLIRYRWAGDEYARVLTAEKLGSSGASLSSNELLEALEDPSFNVRHEAINAISKLKPTPRLVDALVLVLGSDQPDLALTAAWALGKMGDKSAILPLREMLLNEYTLLQARAARSLGVLGDTQSIVFMLKKLHNESDKGLKVAFASALSLLNAQIAIDDIMQLLEETNSQVNRDETALSVARLVGSENRYIRLQRRLKKDTATTAAQTVLALRKFIGYPQKNDVQATELAKNCAAELAEGNIDAGISLLTKLVKNVPAEKHTEISLKVVNRIIAQLEKCGSSRPEYLTLLLHTILTALKPDSQR